MLVAPHCCCVHLVIFSCADFRKGCLCWKYGVEYVRNVTCVKVMTVCNCDLKFESVGLGKNIDISLLVLAMNSEKFGEAALEISFQCLEMLTVIQVPEAYRNSGITAPWTIAFVPGLGFWSSLTLWMHWWWWWISFWEYIFCIFQGVMVNL